MLIVSIYGSAATTIFGRTNIGSGSKADLIKLLRVNLYRGIPTHDAIMFYNVKTTSRRHDDVIIAGYSLPRYRVVIFNLWMRALRVTSFNSLESGQNDLNSAEFSYEFSWMSSLVFSHIFQFCSWGRVPLSPCHTLVRSHGVGTAILNFSVRCEIARKY